MIVRVMFFADYMAKISFTLSLACKPLAFSLMRVKPRFHPQMQDNQQLAESETGETEN